MTSNKVEPNPVFLVFKLSKISRVRYFFNRDLESEASNFLKPSSNLSRTAWSTMVLFLQTEKTNAQRQDRPLSVIFRIYFRSTINHFLAERETQTHRMQ